MEETAIGCRRFKFLIPVVIATVLLQTGVPAFGAGPTYSPGVVAGQWAKYGQISAYWYSSNYTRYPVPPRVSELQSVNSTTITVRNVQGPYITANRIRAYANSTNLSDSLWGDVQTGEGNLTDWILAGNLTAGNGTYQGSGQTFNSTIPRPYLGATRNVNVLNITQSYPALVGTANVKLNAFWDQISGVLLEVHFAFDIVSGTSQLAYGNADAVIVDSNILSPGQPLTVTISSACVTALSSATAGKPVNCSATASGGTAPYTFKWTAVGGTPSSGTGASFTVSYGVKGTFTLTVNATDANNKNAVQSVTNFFVSPQPIAVTVTCGTGVTAGKPVTCNASATGGTTPYAFSWSAPGGSPATGTGASFTTTYATKGTFVINATATDANTVKKSATATVVVAAQPIVVTVTCGTATASKPVTCTASATGGTTPYTFTWFSKGSPATDTGSSYTTIFSTQGYQTINATATDTNDVSELGQATITVQAPPPPPDFSLTATASLSIQTGKSDIATLSISPGNGFTSQVNLTVTAPNGVTVTLSRNSITGSGRIDLTVTIANNLAPGTYTVTVKAIGGSQTHTKTITVTVTATPPSAASNLILGLDPTLFYSIIGAIVTVTIVGGVLAIRMKKQPSPARQAPTGAATIPRIG